MVILIGAIARFRHSLPVYLTQTFGGSRMKISKMKVPEFNTVNSTKCYKKNVTHKSDRFRNCEVGVAIYL